ncbi:MaoC family dehydratase N-terminal domain-containing protein [Paenibacillus sp. J22TS3]|uniref:FAS1-like dehydratase domain-containing protein n=1 Tax=Paenibacillus sp. J22TS3 TaxID=2807192 RepID=UPI001B16F22E|nr:MaoC family dehydratase N-terminal domain-containing protein [Paenibacillus sp. J22TS3]GIP23363.1 hypothetical protein J22TS3_36380 [Paenibacillus sp. J22TS3]
MKKLKFRVHITDSLITQFANSIDAPLRTWNGVLTAPPTMPVIFWKIDDAPWLDPEGTWIHGSQRFEYQAPIMSGMTLDCELILTKVETKRGRQGELTLYTHTLVCSCSGSLIVTSETVLISGG